jgi:Ca-activated chloride channel homolog
MKNLAVICLIGSICLTALGQKPAGQPEDPYTIAVDVNLVLLNVTVLDKKGHMVPGLSQRNFKVYEEGVEQELREFHPEDVPATIGLVIDNSGSMARKREDVIAAATQFVSDSNPQDELFIVNFNDDVSMGLPRPLAFTNSYTVLHDALLRTRADGRTALYDGITTGIGHLKNGTHQRKALIVLSDGGDNASQRSLKDVLRLAGQSTATIYTIGIYDPLDRDRNPKVLRQLSKLTGGEFYAPRSSSQLEDIWHQIAAGIRSQYTIGYFSKKPAHDDTFRKIKVTVTTADGKSLEVRTRTGYRSPE